MHNIKVINEYLEKSDWRVNENANVQYSIGGLILHAAGTHTADYWLYEVYNNAIRNAHMNGDFHIHDLSMLTTYCCGWSLRQLIAEGIGGINSKTSSKPAKHLSTIVQHMINFLGVLQNEAAGAQAFSSVDTYLAPFVRKDKLSYDQVKQCIQTFVFGLNVSSRWGGQSPFSNVTFDWTVPEDMKDQPAILGGEPQDFTYGELQEEMNMINRAFLETMLEGDSDGRLFPYPIPTYNITNDFDWESENAKLLFKMAGKNGTPYFQNFISSDLKPSDVRSMCCRLQLDKRELLKRGGGLFGANEFTGSVGVVTLNLPRIGYTSKNKEELFNKISSLMDIAKDSLELKRKFIINMTDKGLYPYTKRYLGHLGWRNHFSTIGLVGMNECLINFMGKDITDPEAKELANEILVFMRDRLIKYQEETGNLYNLEATPAEGTSYRLAKIDKKKYKNIKTAGANEPYYTNSSQLPVGKTEDIFEALDHQEELQTKYTGGTVFHGFIGESINDGEVVANLIKTIFTKYKIPYLTLSPTFSICCSHGFMSGEHFACPTCGEETEVYSRIVGYYRNIRNWNAGKKEEYTDRKEFKV